jgi:hypothetical protein
MMYSALNLRPYTAPSLDEFSSFFHLAIGYFNITLPSLLPPSVTAVKLFWHRARMAQLQTAAAVKSPFVVSRARETMRVRAERAVKWAKIDDDEAKNKVVTENGGVSLVHSPPPTPIETITCPNIAIRSSSIPVLTPPALPKTSAKTGQISPSLLGDTPPQKALMGLSMLGNLDGMYEYKSFSGLTLTSLTTGSRQRPGGLLFIAYTFT